MSEKPQAKYKTTNWTDYNSSLKKRGEMIIWIDPEMKWHADVVTGKNGRQAVYSDAAIQLCLMMKVAHSLPLRQSTGFVTGLLKLAKLDWSVPDYSTLSTL